MDINKNRIWYEDTATVAKFLMGGIGTGNFSIGSRGQLCDWELFGRPMKGGRLPYTFFAIRTKQGDQPHQVRVLESRLRPPFERSHGYESWDSAGAPRFQRARMAGEISRAVVELRDEGMPVEVDLTAFSPFIPLNPEDSGIPATVLRYRVVNTSDSPLAVSLAGSISNPVGYRGEGIFGAMITDGEPENEYWEEPGTKGFSMTNPSLPGQDLTAGSLAFTTTTDANVTIKPLWATSGWWNGAHDFWNDFKADGRLEPVRPENSNPANPHFDAHRLRVSSLCTDFILAPGEEKEIPFQLCWFFPNRPARWPGHIFHDPDNGQVVKNHYATRFQNAWDVNRYLLENLPRLEKQSGDFRKAFYQTTLPPVMLDAMAANITVLRSTTCFRIEDGTFLGWEGTFDTAGCCEGNCSHVWNYQQTLAFLFPPLERDMRRVNFLLETGEDGEMAYRSNRVFGYERFTKIPPAADGQMGTIVQLYRDWKLSGDDDFLQAMWPQAKKALEYAFVHWDADGDFVFESEQHNTYDIEFFGVTSLTNSIFYAALKAAEEMAGYLGETDTARRYRTAREKGAARMDDLLFNGEYYEQKPDDTANPQYQYGKGCLSDQVLGQELAHMAGLGYILPEAHVKKAVQAVFRHNFRPDLSQHVNVQRVYALGDEGGLICCTWPGGGKPEIPFIYSDEVWTGIEYQVASHLICEGCFDEALTVVETLRARYDGIKRNPWNEVECGNHYVRSMASWGLLLAASGFGYDLTKGEISFSPKAPADDFTCFFSTGKCWGLYRQKRDKNGTRNRGIEILYGDDRAVRLVP